MESTIKKMDRCITTTKTLHGKIKELSPLQNSPHKSSPQNNINDIHLNDVAHKILWQRQEIKYLKKKSLWSTSFDKATTLMARLIFTILKRAKLVFGDGDGLPSSHPHGQSPSSALVHHLSVSSPLPKGTLNLDSFLEPNTITLKPLPSTLGATSLALHYSNLIIAMEKMICSPQLVGANARDDLYAMLPDNIRFTLRTRLKGVGFSANDPGLAGQWRDAVLKILGWMSPLAHNMVNWQSQRVFKQHNLATRAHSNVLLLQTLYFANREKTKAAITELLVGLNYIWRFEREIKARAMSQGINLNPCVNS